MRSPQPRSWSSTIRRARSACDSVFETEDDYRKGDVALNAMPVGDTPGSRSSVTKYDVAIRMAAWSKPAADVVRARLLRHGMRPPSGGREAVALAQRARVGMRRGAPPSTSSRSLPVTSGVTPVVMLIEVSNLDEATRQRFRGCPTIRVDGLDVHPLPDDDAPSLSCRRDNTGHGPERRTRLSPAPACTRTRHLAVITRPRPHPRQDQDAEQHDRHHRRDYHAPQPNRERWSTDAGRLVSGGGCRPSSTTPGEAMGLRRAAPSPATGETRTSAPRRRMGSTACRPGSHGQARADQAYPVTISPASHAGQAAPWRVRLRGLAVSCRVLWGDVGRGRGERTAASGVPGLHYYPPVSRTPAGGLLRQSTAIAKTTPGAHKSG